jgi:hypothetical protein
VVRIANFSIYKRFEIGTGKQHHKNAVAHNHASGLLIGKLRIERKPKFWKNSIDLARFFTGRLINTLVAMFLN